MALSHQTLCVTLLLSQLLLASATESVPSLVPSPQLPVLSDTQSVLPAEDDFIEDEELESKHTKKHAHLGHLEVKSSSQEERALTPPFHPQGLKYDAGVLPDTFMYIYCEPANKTSYENVTAHVNCPEACPVLNLSPWDFQVTLSNHSATTIFITLSGEHYKTTTYTITATVKGVAPAGGSVSWTAATAEFSAVVLLAALGFLASKGQSLLKHATEWIRGSRVTRAAGLYQPLNAEP